MGPNATPVMSLAPVSATPANSLKNIPPTNELSAELGEGQAGLFALLLGQLTLEQPAVGPVVPETAVPFTGLTAATPGDALPVTGKPLPLPPELVIPEAELTPETRVVTADPAVDGDVLPLPGLPQPALTRPVRESLRPQPVSLPNRGPVMASATPTLPPVSPELVARTPELQPLTAAPVTEELPVELVPQASTSRSAITVTPEGFGLPTAAPLTAQPTQPTAPTPSYTLNHPVADARWGESLGQRVMWMTDNGVGRAEIRLNPPELGPLDIRISVANDEARVSFTVQHGVTRDAVESAMPRLREMFAAQGIDLADASVSQHSPEDRRQAGESGDSNDAAGNAGDSGDADGVADIDPGGGTRLHDGLIDTYA